VAGRMSLREAAGHFRRLAGRPEPGPPPGHLPPCRRRAGPLRPGPGLRLGLPGAQGTVCGGGPLV
jgi:hypothetical protein